MHRVIRFTMSKWGQDSQRIAELRKKQESDLLRWSTLDSHNRGWINRAKIAVTSIPPQSNVLELGAGHAFLRDLLPAGCSYTPMDIVPHQPDFLVIDLNSSSWKIPHSDVIVALGTFEYIYDFGGVLNRLRNFTKRIIFTYCCRVEGSSPDLRMRQGWLTDLTQSDVGELINASGLIVKKKTEFQKEVHFTQVMWVTDVKDNISQQFE